MTDPALPINVFHPTFGLGCSLPLHNLNRINKVEYLLKNTSMSGVLPRELRKEKTL